MVYYRMIKRAYTPLNGSVEWSIHDTLLDAYKKCIPNNEIQHKWHCCRRLYMSVIEQLESKQIILVTYSNPILEEGEIPSEPSTMYWIERINSLTEPMPLNPPKPMCCYGKN